MKGIAMICGYSFVKYGFCFGMALDLVNDSKLPEGVESGLRCFSKGFCDRLFHCPWRLQRTRSPRFPTLPQQGDGFSSCLLSPDLSATRFSNPQELKNLVVHRQGPQADTAIILESETEAQVKFRQRV
jgi:hypothetical protein